MFNKLTVIGNVGNTPELRYTSDGKMVANFSVATSGYNDITTWVRVSVFGNQAKACAEYLTKGRQVYVEGRLSVDPETGGPRMFTRQDGTVGTSFEMVARDVKFLGKSEYPTTAEAEVQEEDDVPF